MIEVLNYDNLSNLFIEMSQISNGRYLIFFTDTEKLLEWMFELYMNSDEPGCSVDIRHDVVTCKRTNARIYLATVGDNKKIKSSNPTMPSSFDRVLYEDGIDPRLLPSIRVRKHIRRDFVARTHYESSDALNDFLNDFSIVN